MVYIDGNIRIDLMEKEGVAFIPIENLENTYSKDIMNLLNVYISFIIEIEAKPLVKETCNSTTRP